MFNVHQVRLWATVHKWSSLICTLFLLILCITGLPLIFHDEIDGYIEGKPAAATANNIADRASLGLLLRNGEQRYPSGYPQYLFWPDDEPGIVNLGTAPQKSPNPDQITTLVMSARSGDLIGERPRQTGPMQIVLKLHSELLLGLAGTMFLGAMGAAFLASIVSGAVLYAPFMRRWDFGTVRIGKPARTVWLDLHNLLGIVALTWTIVVGATGIVNTMEKPLFAMWRSEQLPKLLAPYEGRPLPHSLSSVDAALATAVEASPGMQVVSILFPYSAFNSPRHYLIWMKGQTVLTKHLFTAVLVDAENGALSGVLPLPWYLRTLELSRPLHFGDYGGLPLKVIWAVLDIVTMLVLGSGIYLWLRRRPIPSRDQGLPADNRS